MLLGDVLTDTGLRESLGSGYDIVVANILPPVLIPLCPLLKEFVRENGVVIFSGILTEKKESVRAALEEAGFNVTGEKEEKEWSALVSVSGGGH